MHRRKLHRLALLVLFAVVSLASASTAWASANVGMMPDRPALAGTAVVVWGNTKFPNGTPFVMTFGDGTPNFAGNVADQSYIATTHTYAAAGTYTATLTISGETEDVVITVSNPAALSAEQLRAVRILMAIEDGLRYLYFSQNNRAARFNTQFTSWRSASTFDDHAVSYTSLAVQAYQNHGHHLNDDPNEDIYQPVVRRGLNFLTDSLFLQTLTVEPAGNPCVGLGAAPDPCQGLRTAGSHGYATSIVMAAIAGSQALSTTVPAGAGTNSGGYVVGRTYEEILQRLVNTVVWGQTDAGTDRGGWRYSLDSDADTSANGWNVVGLLDAQAAGAEIAMFADNELSFFTANHTVTPVAGQSSLLYTHGWAQGSLMRSGVLLQSLFFMGVPASDPRVTAARDYINAAWNAFHPAGEQFSCGTPSGLAPGSPPGSANNRGCAYSMYQAFKGLKLYGIETLPNVLRPDDDWHEEYKDYLYLNQQAPNTVSGGQWFTPQMHFSCCDTDVTGITAIAELILSEVVLVVPSTLTLTPASASNPVGTSHTVTATATSASGSPVPGATVTFNVTSGPNAGATGSGSTDTAGQTTFTYTSNGVAGTDTIVASIGTLSSNTATKTWVAPTTVCDVDNDGDVDRTDLNLIRAKNGQTSSGPGDPFDPNGDGRINVADVRYCQLRQTSGAAATSRVR